MNKPKILAVDDEPINLSLIEIVFGEKYMVLLANNGDEALKVLEDHNDILIVLSDMKMPNMSGIEFINRAFPNYPEIKYYITEL